MGHTPRRARLSVAGIPWHIIQRGNNRAVCFHAEEDYRRYLDDLAEQSKRFNCAIHAYVLMTNHVHLLLTPQKTDSAGQMMKHLGQRYVQYVNRAYRRSGTLARVRSGRGCGPAGPGPPRSARSPVAALPRTPGAPGA